MSVKREQKKFRNGFDCIKGSLEILVKDVVLSVLQSDDFKSIMNDVLLGILEKGNSQLEHTKKDLETKTAEFNSVSKKLERTREDLETKMAEFNSVSNKLERTQKDLETKTVEFNGVSKELERTREDLETKTVEFNDVSKKLERTQKDLQIKIAEFNSVSKKLERTQKDLETKTAEFNRVSKELDNIKEKLDDKTDKLEDVSKELDYFKSDLDDATEKYVGIYRLMCKCESMKNFLEEMIGVSEDRDLSVAEVIKLTNLIGNDFSLARNIYVTLEKYKSSHNEFLTSDEISFINAVNEMYSSREKNPCNYVVLDCLSLENNQEKEFNRKIMKDLTKARSTDFVLAKGIYVPALRTEEGNDYERKAIVKGD